MGNKQCVIKHGEGHGDLYERGAAAAREGRYAVAELYFQQALRQHPGRAFWVAISANILGTSLARKKNRGRNNAGTPAEGDKNDLDGSLEAEGKRKKTAKRVLSPEEAAGVPCYYDHDREKLMLELPLDEDGLTPILEYIRLVTDITHQYLQRRPDTPNCRIALVYCGYTCVHLQLFWFLFMVWYEAHAAALLAATREINEQHNKEAYTVYVQQHRHHLTRGNGGGGGGGLKVSANASTSSAREDVPDGGDDEEQEAVSEHPTEGDEENPLQQETKADEALADVSVDGQLAPPGQRSLSVPLTERFTTSGRFVSSMQLRSLFQLMTSYLRYHYLTAATNYTFLVLLFANELDGTEVRRRQRIFENVVELITRTQCDLIGLAEQCAAEAERSDRVAPAILRQMPSTSYELTDQEDVASAASSGGIPSSGMEDGSKGRSGGDGSHSASAGQTIGFYAALDGVSLSQYNGSGAALPGAQASTFLFVAREFNLTMPITFSLTTNVAVELYVDPTISIFRRPKGRLATVPSAAERSTFHYCCWYMPLYLQYVPGHNTHYLQHALPAQYRYTGPPEGPHSSLYLKPKSDDDNSTLLSLLAKGTATATTTLTAYEEDSKEWNQKKAERTKQQTPHVNPLLDRQDPLILSKISFEEAFALAAPLFAIAAQMLVTLGDEKRARQYERFVQKGSAAMFGAESAEYEQLSHLGQCTALKYLTRR